MLEKVDKSRRHENQEDKEASENNINHYYTASRNRYWFGTTFKLDFFSWNQTEIALRVELGEGGWILYGFILLEDDKRVKSCDNEKYNTLAEKWSGDGFTRNHNWLGWKYPKDDVWFPVKSDAKADLFLLDGSEREKAIQELVNEIAAEVSKLKNNLE